MIQDQTKKDINIHSTITIASVSLKSNAFVRRILVAVTQRHARRSLYLNKTTESYVLAHFNLSINSSKNAPFSY